MTKKGIEERGSKKQRQLEVERNEMRLRDKDRKVELVGKDEKDRERIGGPEAERKRSRAQEEYRAIDEGFKKRGHTQVCSSESAGGASHRVTFIIGKETETG